MQNKQEYSKAKPNLFICKNSLIFWYSYITKLGHKMIKTKPIHLEDMRVFPHHFQILSALYWFHPHTNHAKISSSKFQELNHKTKAQYLLLESISLTTMYSYFHFTVLNARLIPSIMQTMQENLEYFMELNHNIRAEIIKL